MKTTPLTRGSLGLLVLALQTLCGTSAFAQTAPPANSQTPPPKTTTTTTTTTPKPAKQVKVSPSRYVSDDDLDAYLDTLAATFSMRNRATDPFGLLQDPNAKPIVKATTAKPSRRIAPILATPFADIIKLIKVTTVMPKDKTFLVGTRSIKQGDQLPLTYRSKVIRVQVASVTSYLIEFRNLENGETAALKLNLLPTGMTPGTLSLTAPGMTPTRPDAPIELDGGSPLNDKPVNR